MKKEHEPSRAVRAAIQKLSKATDKQKEEFLVIMLGRMTNRGPDKRDELLAEVRASVAQSKKKPVKALRRKKRV